MENVNLSHFKSGMQYTHYCGTELAELNSCIWLAMELVDENREESIAYGKRALEMVDRLTIKIQELDKINNMKY